MMIDWSTVLFQIINFIILVFLLRKFLYGPIVTVMDQREQEILDREARAQQKAQTAVQTTHDYEHRIKELDNEKEETYKSMRQEVVKQKQELINESKAEIATLQKQWQKEVSLEANRYMIELRDQLSRYACHLANLTLNQLADVSLELVVFDVFINKLNQLSDQESDKMIEAFKQEQHGHLKSAFSITDQQKEKITHTLKALTDLSITLSFSQESKLGCGFLLELEGYRIGWNTTHYLDDIQEKILKSLPTLNEDDQNESE